MWTAHARVGPFPSGQQGLDALKKLREFRKLHELSWNKHNPEWSKETKKKLIRLIMDQRQNTSADLAKVLSIQEEMGAWMAKKGNDRRHERNQYLGKRWKEIEALAQKVEEGKIKELDRKIRDCKSERGNKLHDDKEVHRLDKEASRIRREIRELLWASHIVKQRDSLDAHNEKTFERELWRMKKEEAALRKQGKHDLANRLRIPKKKRSYEVRNKLIPKSLKAMPTPYSLKGIEIQWADLYDAEYAGETWPQAVVHAPIQSRRIVTEEEYHTGIENHKKAIADQTRRILEDIAIDTENKRREAEGLPALTREEVVPEAPKKTGYGRYLPDWMSFKNPFKRASA